MIDVIWNVQRQTTLPIQKNISDVVVRIAGHVVHLPRVSVKAVNWDMNRERGVLRRPDVKSKCVVSGTEN
jgi:hypothetical protein